MWPLLLWRLLKLLEPPTAPTPVALTSPAATAKAPATAPASAEKPRGAVAGGRGAVAGGPTGFGEKCYQLLHRLLTEEASPAAKMASDERS